MPRYDVKCVRCSKQRDNVWFSNYRDAVGHTTIELAPCDCGEKFFERMPSAPNFQVHGYNAQNGYSK